MKELEPGACAPTIADEDRPAGGLRCRCDGLVGDYWSQVSPMGILVLQDESLAVDKILAGRSLP